MFRILTSSVITLSFTAAEVVLGDHTDEKKIDQLFGLSLNENYIDHGHAPYNKYDDVHVDYSITDLLKRHQKFQKPAKNVQEELKREHLDNPDFEPVIGILTQPVSLEKRDEFPYTDYILEVNDNFIRWPGSRTVAIPFNISEAELNELLPQINGVLFTGGALDLINTETGEEHIYYKTTKRIVQYSQNLFDEQGQEWPIIGICQGNEVLSLIFGDDDPNTLNPIFIYGRNRAVEWTNDPLESKMWGGFPKSLTDKMQTQGLTIHAHSFSVSVATFKSHKHLNDSWTITQTDTLGLDDGTSIKYIGSMEHQKYPFYTTMYHPEYQLQVFTGKKKWNLVNNDDTDEIAFRLSLRVNRDARKKQKQNPQRR